MRHASSELSDDPPQFMEDHDSARILLVDDHPQNLLALEAILSPFGHHLVQASSGDSALRALLADDFALILLDVQMPGFDGFETAKLIRSHRRTAHIPIIFITAIHRSVAHIHRGYAAGAVDYIVKPFDPEVLRCKVAVFVELYQKTKVIKEQSKLIHAQQRISLELRYRNLTEALTIPMWAERANGEAYYSNRAFLEYAGVDSSAAFGFKTRGFVHPSDATKIEFETARSHQTDAFEVEVRLRRADGAYRWHLARSLREPEGKGRVVIAADIDDRRRSEDALAQLVLRERNARAQAEEANRSKDAFLATVSHELRTPLNAILGWSQLLLGGQLDEEHRARAVETIERNARAQSHLISDLFDVSRIVTGKIRLDVRPIDLPKIVRDVVESLQPQIEAKNIDVEMQLETLDFPMGADAGRLQQVVLNLLTNALKFGAKKVRITLEKKETEVVISVIDDGQGIGPDFLPQVFDRFEQADSRTTRAQGGLGLGLSIVRHLVKLHGGTVAAASDGIGRGARFTVSLPISRSGAHAIGLLPKKATTATLDGARVLVVDDDEDGRELLAAVLSRCGANVRAVCSLSEAVAEIRRETPHVLVSDIGMPGADGYELIRTVRAAETSNTRLPAIALTAYASKRDRDLALNAGFDEHLPKPVDVSALASAIERLVRAS